MPSTILGIVRGMVYFWEMVNVLLQPRCDNIDCGSYDITFTGETKRLPSLEALPQIDPGLGGITYSSPQVLCGYKCNKCQGISWQ